MIRQTTINCAERGFLLVRVRDEIKMTIQAYQTLYESSVAYGMRKALQAEQSKAEKLLQLASLEKRCMEKENEINDLRRHINDKLEDEKAEKEEKDAEHERETQARKDKNLTVLKQLGEILMNLNKSDDWSYARSKCSNVCMIQIAIKKLVVIYSKFLFIIV